MRHRLWLSLMLSGCFAKVGCGNGIITDAATNTVTVTKSSATKGFRNGHRNLRYKESTRLLELSEPEPQPHIKFFGSDPVDKFPLGLCEGDCDEDSECAEGLVCFQRTHYDPVPGCEGGPDDASRNDYCIDPAALVPEGDVPSAAPSNAPSSIPSSSPSSEPIPPSEKDNDDNDDTAENASNPSSSPSEVPTNFPSEAPSHHPTIKPSDSPSGIPSSSPSLATTTNDASDIDDVDDTAGADSNPSSSPSALPSSSPTTTPSGMPSSKVPPHIKFLGTDPIDNFPLGLCEGDCDEDSECAEGLVCFQRTHYDPVPGCEGGPNDASRNDYCIDPAALLSEGAVPTATPSHYPTKMPTTSPSSLPSSSPSSEPTPPGNNDNDNDDDGDTTLSASIPSSSPSALPSSSPTTAHSGIPSADPSVNPTTMPTNYPSVWPTALPSIRPTTTPSTMPSVTFSQTPTVYPSANPTVVEPSASPTDELSSNPTTTHSESPTISPSVWPTALPSIRPTSTPSTMPSVSPSQTPTVSPSVTPSVAEPSASPTDELSSNPTTTHSGSPTISPSTRPSNSPTKTPTTSPSVEPSLAPSFSPSRKPTHAPSLFPSFSPSFGPSTLPSANPSTTPSRKPTQYPSMLPSLLPSSSPTFRPSELPSVYSSEAPSYVPSTSPPVAAIPLVNYGGTPPADKFPLQQCEGDCDGDSACAPGLYCFQRSSYEEVPGCIGGGSDDSTTDYCTSVYDGPPAPSPTADMFRLKLYWEEGYYWQEELFEREWCMACVDECKEGNRLHIVECFNTAVSYFDFVDLDTNNGDDEVLIQVVNTDLCLDRRHRRVVLDTCNENDDGQRWIALDGSFTDYRFEITQIGQEIDVMNQHHHPKYGELINMQTLENSRTSKTSYWEKY